MSEHIKFLKKIHKQYATSYPSHDNYNYSSRITEPPFSHRLIVWCAKEIGAKKSFKPLFELWQEFELYQGIDPEDDYIFLKDCCKLLFIAYNRMLCNLDDCYKSKIGLEEVRNLYATIAMLPLAKFVSLLDRIVVGLTMAITQSTQQGDGSILGWVKQNWWIPPTVVAGIITALVLGRKRIESREMESFLL